MAGLANAVIDAQLQDLGEDDHSALVATMDDTLPGVTRQKGRGLCEGNGANMSRQPIGHARALYPLNMNCWRGNSGGREVRRIPQKLLPSLVRSTQRTFRFRLPGNVFGFSVNSTLEIHDTSSHASFGCTASSTAMRTSARSTLSHSVRSAARRVRPPRWKPCAACIGAWGGQVRRS